MKLLSKINAIIVLLSFLILIPVIAQAQFKKEFTDFGASLKEAAYTATYPTSQENEAYINIKFGALITMMFIGITFLIIIIYSGIGWMTAGGNEEKIEKSKKRVVSAAIGFVLVLSSYIITTFVYNYFDAKFLTTPTGQIEQNSGPQNNPQNDADCARIDASKPRLLIEDGSCVACLIDDDCNGFWNLNFCNPEHECQERF